VVSGGANSNIAWHRNNGGSPIGWTSFPLASSATTVWVHGADVNSDGRVDIIAALYGSNSVGLYVNNGGSPVSWSPSLINNGGASGAYSVYTADLDGDGRLDVLSASVGDNKIAWYRNNGGTPLSWTAFTISTNALDALSVYAADVNGDGRPDVLSASKSDNKVAWYRNNGGSPLTWTEFVIATNAAWPFSVHAADVDGDGRWCAPPTVENPSCAWPALCVARHCAVD
jgi:hypothetical protein